MAVSLKIDDDADNVAVFRTTSANNFATWMKLDTELEGDVAYFKAEGGGVYVARSVSGINFIVPLICSLLVVLLIIGGALFYFKRNPDRWQKLKGDAKNVKRNFADTV